VFKSFVLKLPLLLTQFLYKNKRLSLPGLGIFTLDPAAIIPEGHGKNTHTTAGIEFKQVPIHDPEDELIEYIRVHTGKIKPVAVADLDSYLALGNEMLNIGKPFFLEGIGTITKNMEGGLEFNPGEYSVVKHEDSHSEKHDKAGKRKSVLEEAQFEPQPNNIRKILMLVAIVGGLSVIGLGGYYFYKKNANGSSHPEISTTVTDTIAFKKDTIQAVSADSAKNKAIVPLHSLSKDSIMYKFIILETYNKARALKRYNQLLSYDLKINMHTKDSSFFKLYFSFPALPKDTARIKDSLYSQYAHRVTIER
jgi:hypothetical protein